MTGDFLSAPDNLPMPIDDGAADHLLNMPIPDLALSSTMGRDINLYNYADFTVLYIYPMTGVPGTDLPPGWDDMPGARGCTPQSCALRDAHEDIKAHGATLVGLSCQTTEYQSEMAKRLNLDFPVLSDASFKFAEQLSLPEFSLDSQRYLKRLTMIIQQNIIKAVHYPVFPSTADPEWLEVTLPLLTRSR